MRLSHCLVVGLCVGLIVSTAVAGEKTTGADFLRIDPGARASAMGSGFAALAEDVQGLYYNPAGLALVGFPQFTATHMEWVAGIQNEYMAFAFPAGPVGWGLGVMYMHSEETERDALGRKQSTFNVGEGAFFAGMGVRLNEHHHLGLTAKIIERTLYHRTTHGFAADLGYQYRRQTEGGSFWKVGAALKNIGPDIGFAIKEKLPTEIEISTAYQPMLWYRRPFTFTCAITEGTFQKGIAGSLGLEGTLLSRFHLRMGYALGGSRDEKLRAGFGVDLFEFGRIDFAAVRIGRFNSSLLMSLTLQMSKK